MTDSETDNRGTDDSCSFCPAMAEERKKAAREIEDLLLSLFWFQPPKENEPVIYRDQAIEAIREKFGLEI